jgi:hypothetical protein
MKRKIVGLFICMLMITTVIPLTAMAGDENDPEIIDEENDCFGPLITLPFQLKFLQIFGILPIDSFDFIDIVSAWFYENSNEPDYLYAAVKLKDLIVIKQDAIYTASWFCNGRGYVVGSHISNNGERTSCQVGLLTWINRDNHAAEATYDFEKNIVTFKFSKEYIGNPNPGDVLTKTSAWTGLRLNLEPLTLLFGSGELAKDGAPNNATSGKDYVIQY